MISRETEAYIRGLSHMLYSCCPGIGCSGLEIGCYESSRFAAEFSEDFDFAPGVFRLVPTEEPLSQILTGWLGEPDEKKANEYLWLIRCKLGKPLQTYRAADEKAIIDRMSGSEDGFGPFFFMEDICFAKFEKATVCFMMGNNE